MFANLTLNFDRAAFFQLIITRVKESQQIGVSLEMVLLEMVNKVVVLELLATTHRTCFLCENPMSNEMLSVLVILENFFEGLTLFFSTSEIMILYDFSIAYRY